MGCLRRWGWHRGSHPLWCHRWRAHRLAVTRVGVSRVKQELKRAARRKGKAAAGGARPEAGAPVAGEALREELKADISRISDELAGTRLAVRSTTKGVGHLVKFSGRALHPSEWTTICGWHFANAPHEPCTVAEVSCRRGCLVAAGQVGQAASSGNDPRALHRRAVVASQEKSAGTVGRYGGCHYYYYYYYRHPVFEVLV